MVCPGVLIGLVLFSLTSSGVSAVEVDQNTLANIIKFIDTKYQPSDGVQYAVAINVQASQCGTGFSEGSFLSGEDAEAVKKALKDKTLYQGQQLVVATPKGFCLKQAILAAIHSERALLMCGDNNDADTPVQNLLNKKKDGCVVFYTYNSPCLDYCLNQKADESERHREKIQREKGRPNVGPAVQNCILKSLSVLTSHGGPKAFVFSKVYNEGKDKPTLEAALRLVAEKVPLYKCDGGSCLKCLDNNLKFEDKCLS